MIDEGPSPEDIARFGEGDETGYCPACGAEIWDVVDVCPECHEVLSGGPDRRPPEARHVHRAMVTIVVVLMLIGLLMLLL